MQHLTHLQQVQKCLLLLLLIGTPVASYSDLIYGLHRIMRGRIMSVQFGLFQQLRRLRSKRREKWGNANDA